MISSLPQRSVRPIFPNNTPDGADVFSDRWDDDAGNDGPAAEGGQDAAPPVPEAVEEEVDLIEDAHQPPPRAVPEGEASVQRATGRPAPRMPSQKGWDEHFLTHHPCRVMVKPAPKFEYI